METFEGSIISVMGPIREGIIDMTTEGFRFVKELPNARKISLGKFQKSILERFGGLPEGITGRYPVLSLDRSLV